MKWSISFERKGGDFPEYKLYSVDLCIDFAFQEFRINTNSNFNYPFVFIVKNEWADIRIGMTKQDVLNLMEDWKNLHKRHYNDTETSE